MYFYDENYLEICMVWDQFHNLGIVTLGRKQFD